MDAITTDTFFNGRLRVKQHKCGYRFSIDAVLLAYYANPHAGDHVLDLGTGCGIIPLLMCYRHSDAQVVAVEIQQELAQLAQINVLENQMTAQIKVICKDMRALLLDDVSGPVDLVVSKGPATISVPGVVGRSLARAREDLQKAGFTVGNLRFRVDDDRMDGVILDQNPAAKQEAPKGSAVDLVVNRT